MDWVSLANSASFNLTLLDLMHLQKVIRGRCNVFCSSGMAISSISSYICRLYMLNMTKLSLQSTCYMYDGIYSLTLPGTIGYSCIIELPTPKLTA